MKVEPFSFVLTIFVVIIFIFMQPYIYIGIKGKDTLSAHSRGIIEILHGGNADIAPFVAKIYTSFARLRVFRLCLTIFLLIVLFITHYLPIESGLKIVTYLSMMSACLFLGFINIFGILLMLTSL